MGMEEAKTAWEQGQIVKCWFCGKGLSPSDCEEFECLMMHGRCVTQLEENREYYNWSG